MATVKKSKKRIIVPIAIVLVIAIIVTSIFIVRKVNGGEQVTLHTISTGDIYETVSATGDVTAGAGRHCGNCKRSVCPKGRQGQRGRQIGYL